jgi:hypothetical protein
MVWWHPTWNLFHIFTANIIEESFNDIFKNEIIDLFIKICNKIPCGFCVAHASEHMKTINKDEIKTARDLELFFWKFHNQVNENTNKELFPEENLIVYKKNYVREITTEFEYVLQNYYHNEELLKEFTTWTQANKNNFINYTNSENNENVNLTNPICNEFLKPNDEYMIMSGPWISNEGLVDNISVIDSGEKVYIKHEPPFTKMVTTSNVQKYYQGHIADYKPCNWSKYNLIPIPNLYVISKDSGSHFTT